MYKKRIQQTRNKLLEFSESFCSFENEISQIYLPLLK